MGEPLPKTYGLRLARAPVGSAPGRTRHVRGDGRCASSAHRPFAARLTGSYSCARRRRRAAGPRAPRQSCPTCRRQSRPCTWAGGMSKSNIATRGRTMGAPLLQLLVVQRRARRVVVHLHRAARRRAAVPRLLRAAVPRALARLAAQIGVQHGLAGRGLLARLALAARAPVQDAEARGRKHGHPKEDARQQHRARVLGQ